MKKILTCAIAFMCFNISASAQQWIDVTDTYIFNPRYDNNDLSGWSGTPLGAVGQLENAEHYQKNYDTYQLLSGLKTGKYRLSLQAYYRMGSAANDYSLYTSGNYGGHQYAQLYATSTLGDYYVAIKPASSGRSKTNLGGAVSGVGNSVGWGSYEYYLPNNMEAAYYWFQAGYYKNSVEFEVAEDGALKIGIRKNQTVSEDWTCLDNWKLEYWGEVTNATSVSLNESDITLTKGEEHQLTATILPEEATYHKVNWSSSKTSVVKVDENGNLKAVATGTATITATAIDGGGAKATCTVTVVSPASPSADNIIINEVMPANVDVYRDPSTNFGSWAELYNPTDKGVDLGGLYVSDDADNLKKCHLNSDYGVLPANGYAMLNFDHHDQWTALSWRQIDMKLNCEGGSLYISDGKDIFSQINYPQTVSRASYARTSDGAGAWGFTTNPTPCSSNSASIFASKQLDAPVVTPQARLFSGSTTVEVNIPEGCTLRYTTDGTAPTMTNGMTSETGRFTVSNTTCYRFRLFKDDMLASAVVTRSYIRNSGNEPFPVISIVTDQSNIFKGDMAIFQRSEYGRPGCGQSTKCNWNMDWDRPVNFEFITTDNECVVSQECDFSACGGWSRAWEPHSFKLKATKTYDLKNSFNYQFFDEKPYLKHKTLQIRNGGNDNGCRIKDAAIQRLISSSGLNVEHQAWQPVHVFFNGEPYAVLNMREPNNKHYGYANYGIDTNLMDQFEISPDSGYVQMTGTKDSFNRWYTLAKTASSAASYEEICKLVDIDEYVNYMAAELYACTTDWPQNNVKGFRSTEDGRFRFVLFDLDAAFSTNTPFDTFFWKENYTFDSRYGYDYSTGKTITGTRLNEENEFVTIFRNMLGNATFRRKFIDAFCLMAGSVCTPDRAKSVISEMATYLNTGNYVNPWNTANSVIGSFSASLQQEMINQLKNCSYMKLSGNANNVSLSSNIEGARLLVNDMEVPTGKFGGKLFAPVTVSASAPAGYRFVGWESTDGGSIAQTVFSNGSQWKYYDTGSLDGVSWKSATYDDGKWKSGAAPLGYGKNESTLTAKYKSCYYFRKSFELSDVESDDVFSLSYTVDDGMVVYINGQEAGRYNMPSGTVNYSTFATTYANNNPDTGTMGLNTSLFVNGTNVIAIEVHNNSASSSDILIDAELSRKTRSQGSLVSTDTSYKLPSSGTVALVAVWEKMSDAELAEAVSAPIRVNEVSAGNDIYVNEQFKKNDWIELYNNTEVEMDVAGLYISDNMAKLQKYQIPASDAVNTKIPARGHLVLWADKLEGESQVHTGFKLGNTDGSIVVISASDEFVANNANYFNAHPQDAAFMDMLTYCAHAYDQTVGRYPDGGNDFYLFNRPTIAFANSRTGIDKYLSTDSGIDITGIEEINDLVEKASPDGREGFYSINGMFMGTSFDSLKPGLYINPSTGRKIVKRN